MMVMLLLKTEDRHLKLNLRVCYKNTDGVYNKVGIISSTKILDGFIHYEIDNAMGLYLADELKLIMPEVEVEFENKEYNYSTSIAYNISHKEAHEYFVGTVFNLGAYPAENLQRCISINYK